MRPALEQLRDQVLGRAAELLLDRILEEGASARASPIGITGRDSMKTQLAGGRDLVPIGSRSYSSRNVRKKATKPKSPDLDADGDVRCPVDGRYFASERAYRAHRDQAHPTNPDRASRTCPSCSATWRPYRAQPKKCPRCNHKLEAQAGDGGAT